MSAPMPKPEIQILVCVNERPPGAVKPCCGRRDGLAIYRRFKDRVRALGVRDRVMVNRTGCLKHCSRGTTVAVWPRNHWYAEVTLDDVESIVDHELAGAPEELERLAMPDIPWE